MSMGLRWQRTGEQQVYLDLVLPQYYQAQIDGKGSAYILHVAEEWLKRWPERDIQPGPNDPPLAEGARRRLAVAKRQKQLGNYLQWHVDKLKISGGRVSRAKSDPLAKILKQAAKRRKKQPAQVFAQLFRDKVNERLQLIMPSSMPTGATDVKAYQAQRLGARTKLVYQMWQEADEETRNVVYAAKEEMDQDAGLVSEDKEKMEGQPDEGSAKVPGAADSITRAEMQKNINNLGQVVIRIVKELAKKTGWSFTVLMGGINEQGVPDIASVNVGATPTTGLNFAEYIVDYDTKILQPFREFLSVVYPPDLRQAFAVEYAMKIAKNANESVDKMEETAMDTNPDGTEMEAMAAFVPPSSSPSQTATVTPLATPAIPQFDFSGVSFDTMNLNSLGSIDASMNLDASFASMDLDASFGLSDASMNIDPSFGLIGASQNDFSVFDTFMAATEGENNFRPLQLGASSSMDDMQRELMSGSLGLMYQTPGLTASFPPGVISNSDNISPTSVPPLFFGDMPFHGLPAIPAVEGTFSQPPGGEFQIAASTPMMTVSAQTVADAGDLGSQPALMGQILNTPMTTSAQTVTSAGDPEGQVLTESAHAVTGASDLGPPPRATTDSVPASEDAVRKAKKPTKKAKARDKASKVVGGIDQVGTGSGEVAGERNSPNVNTSRRPIRERKKKEPMGAAYEREVEKWVKKGRK
ncbi:hypothetical protein JOM56_014644 [Amanita muscaria]